MIYLHYQHLWRPIDIGIRHACEFWKLLVYIVPLSDCDGGSLRLPYPKTCRFLCLLWNRVTGSSEGGGDGVDMLFAESVTGIGSILAAPWALTSQLSTCLDENASNGICFPLALALRDCLRSPMSLWIWKPPRCFGGVASPGIRKVYLRDGRSGTNATPGRVLVPLLDRVLLYPVTHNVP